MIYLVINIHIVQCRFEPYIVGKIIADRIL